MRNLLYKEFNLSINRFFYILPFLLAGLMMIPQWIFIIVFMYFFWISVPQIYATYNSQGDYLFTNCLPVSKKSIAISKALSLILLEVLHFITALVVAIIHNLVYGSFNFSLDMNVAFFGLVLIMFALFNIVFLPLYFKTAYHFGKPLIIGVIVTLIYGTALELLNVYYLSFNEILEGQENKIWQFAILIVGILLFITLNFIAIKISIGKYEKVNQ